MSLITIESTYPTDVELVRNALAAEIVRLTQVEETLIAHGVTKSGKSIHIGALQRMLKSVFVADTRKDALRKVILAETLKATRPWSDSELTTTDEIEHALHNEEKTLDDFVAEFVMSEIQRVTGYTKPMLRSPYKSGTAHRVPIDG